jgi:hypothetical protein
MSQLITRNISRKNSLQEFIYTLGKVFRRLGVTGQVIFVRAWMHAPSEMRERRIDSRLVLQLRPYIGRGGHVT